MMQHLYKTLVLSGILLAALGLVVFQISGLGTAVLAAGLDEATTVVVTWGPSYDDDTIVEPERGRAELDFMREIDQRAFNDQRFSPSYDGNETIVAAGPKVNVSNGVAWGPSYDTGRPTLHRDDLSFMNVIDDKALNGQRLSPSYADGETISGAKPGATVVTAQSWGPAYNGADPIQNRILLGSEIFVINENTD